jgi:hypothetical protein
MNLERRHEIEDKVADVVRNVKAVIDDRIDHFDDGDWCFKGLKLYVVLGEAADAVVGTAILDRKKRFEGI